MRKHVFTIAILSALTWCVSTGCKHDAGIIVLPVAQPAPAGPSAGNWIINYLVLGTEDMSHHLDGYTFTFKQGGAIAVDTKVTIVDGSWITSMESNNPKIVMSMANADAMLAELNHDWIIKTNNDTSLQITRGAGFTYSEVHFIRP